jgi:hypothetical protein
MVMARMLHNPPTSWSSMSPPTISISRPRRCWWEH